MPATAGKYWSRSFHGGFERKAPTMLFRDTSTDRVDREWPARPAASSTWMTWRLAASRRRPKEMAFRDANGLAPTTCRARPSKSRWRVWSGALGGEGIIPVRSTSPSQFRVVPRRCDCARRATARRPGGPQTRMTCAASFSALRIPSGGRGTFPDSRRARTRGRRSTGGGPRKSPTSRRHGAEETRACR